MGPGWSRTAGLGLQGFVRPAVLAGQAAVFGVVASDSRWWRLLDCLDGRALAAVAAARARAGELVWAQRAETRSPRDSARGGMDGPGPRLLGDEDLLAHPSLPRVQNANRHKLVLQEVTEEIDGSRCNARGASDIARGAVRCGWRGFSVGDTARRQRKSDGRGGSGKH